MNQLKRLLEVLHTHSCEHGIETEDAFLAGLTLGNLFVMDGDKKLGEILTNITAQN